VWRNASLALLGLLATIDSGTSSLGTGAGLSSGAELRGPIVTTLCIQGSYDHDPKTGFTPMAHNPLVAGIVLGICKLL